MELKPSILIIGGTSKFGQRFHSLFERYGANVTSIGRGRKTQQKSLIRESDIVIVSVPIHKTEKVLREVTPYMKKESLLADFTSLKKFPTDIMRKSPSGVLGMHPLWGPLVADLTERNIVFCPIKENRYSGYLKEVFKEEKVRVIEMTPEEHDKKMAYVQALAHATAINFLETATDDFNIMELLEISTPIFKNQTLLGGRILAGNPDLYSSIQEYNPYFDKVLKKQIKNLKEHRKLLKKGLLPGHLKKVASKLQSFILQAKEESKKIL